MKAATAFFLNTNGPNVNQGQSGQPTEFTLAPATSIKPRTSRKTSRNIFEQTLSPDFGVYDFTAVSIEDLRGLWHRHCKEPIPHNLPRSLLARLLAYRLQVERFGGLPKSLSVALQRIEAELTKSTEVKIAPARPNQLSNGSQMVREHNGTLHRVTVRTSGFEWQGQIFNSLTAVAYAITGTRWNGRRFFGLKPEIDLTIEAKI